MRKAIAITIIFLLLFCSFAPASKSDSEPAPAFTVGSIGPETGTYYDNRLRIVEAAGGKMVTVKMDYDASWEINYTKNMIDAGCDGFTMMPMNEAVLPQVVEMCEAAGVYWSIFMRPLHDQEIKQIVESSPYYAGHVQENDEETAYEIVRQLGMEGKKKMALIMPKRSDPVGEARARGLYRAAEQFGVEIVAEISNASSEEDVFDAVSDIIVVNPDLDAIFRVGSMIRNSTRAAIRAIESSGLKITFASIDLEGITEEDFEKGLVAVAAGGHKELDHVLSTGILVNAINKTPISRDGPAAVTVNYLIIRSAQDLRKYNLAYAENGGVLFSTDAARQMLLRKYNDTLTQEDYDNITSAHTLENLSVLKKWNPA